ncbi:MAG: LppX_LprAFG lipoprotein [Aeromicrobium sp.]
MRTRHLLPALLASVLLLAGCSGSSDASGGSDGGDGKDAAADLAARLANAKETLDGAETIKVSLATKSLPDGITGLLSAEGSGNHSPAFEGTVTVVTGGASLGAEVIATGGKVYAKTGFLPDFTPIDPASLKAPDPALLISADQGITQILVATHGLTEDGQTRDGNDVLTTIKGTLAGDVVQNIIPSADAAETFAVTYRLDDDDALRDATLTGPFYPGGEDVTYRVALETSDAPVTIEAP